MHWYIKVLKHYAVFTGRARREEYWMFFLFNLIIGFVLTLFERVLGVDPFLSGLYNLAIFIPFLAVTVRRLHDTDRSGWGWFIVMIPLLGALILFVFTLLDSSPGRNVYGDNPKNVNE